MRKKLVKQFPILYKYYKKIKFYTSNLIINNIIYITKKIYARKIYSGEGEDIILYNFFLNKKEPGFYIDIGSHHPLRYSNTYLFYQLGWRGINIDAMPGSMKLFKKIRPLDINLEVGISSQKGFFDYFIYDELLINSFSKELRAQNLNDPTNRDLKEIIKVQTERLDTILDKYLPQDQKIDFMSIDVEGLDFEVLKSNNWSKYRPTFVLIEILANPDGLHLDKFHLSIDDIIKHEINIYMKLNYYILYARSGNTVFYRNSK